MNAITKARLVLAAGGILAAVLFVKLSIIGYYQSELVGLGILGAICIAVLLAGNRMHTQAKKAAATAAARHREQG